MSYKRDFTKTNIKQSANILPGPESNQYELNHDHCCRWPPPETTIRRRKPEPQSSSTSPCRQHHHLAHRRTHNRRRLERRRRRRSTRVWVWCVCTGDMR
ncbi:hypothetical protein Hanom_Chr13g01209121 [Helianthus anomalus]